MSLDLKDDYYDGAALEDCADDGSNVMDDEELPSKDYHSIGDNGPVAGIKLQRTAVARSPALSLSLTPPLCPPRSERTDDEA